MQTVTLDQAKLRLTDLIEAAAAGEEIWIQKDENVSVQLVPHQSKEVSRQVGSARGLIQMAPNFDEPLDEFKEYMESIWNELLARHSRPDLVYHR